MGSEKDFKHQAPGATGYDQNHPCAAHLVVDRDTATVDLGDRKKIAICGFASSSRHLIPTDDPTWVIAGLNQLYRHMPRADVWYDIHTNWAEHNVEGTDHEGWLRDCGIPVYMSHVPKEVPNALSYPVERLIARHGLDYFTSTVSFMVAWAIDSIEVAIAKHGGSFKDYTIGVFGIDLIVGTEYDFQKSCAEFWLGIASGLGINVLIPPQSALLKQTHRYGYELEPSVGKISMLELKARADELTAISKNMAPKLHAMNGALQALQQLVPKDIVQSNPDMLALVHSGIKETSENISRLLAEIQTYDGAAQEAQHHVNVMELRMRGGAVPLAQNIKAV